MAVVSLKVEQIERDGETRAGRIQVDAANELEEVRHVLVEDVFEVVLKEMAGTAMYTAPAQFRMRS